jgi:hypothetical protein
MFNPDTAYVARRWRYAFVFVAVSFLFLMFTLGAYAEEVVFKVKFQGKDVPGECLVALIFTAQVEYYTTYEGSAELGGQLQPGDYIAWIYIDDEDMERVYGDNVSQQPGQKVIDFSVKKGVKTVENVNLPTAFEFVQSPDFARIWQLSSSMLGGMFGGDFFGDDWDSDYDYDYDYDDTDYDYDRGIGDWFGEGAWDYESQSSSRAQSKPDNRPDLKPYGPEYN